MTAGWSQVSKVDSTTVIVLAAIFGTLGVIIAIALAYCAIEKMIEVFKKCRQKHLNTVQTKPMVENEDGGTSRTLKTREENNLNRATTIGEAERAKWNEGRILTELQTDDHPADDENSVLPSKKIKVPNKKAPPPIKKLFLDGKVTDATPSTADQEDPFKRENSRAPRAKANPVKQMFMNGVTEEQVKFYQHQIDNAEDLVEVAEKLKRKRE
jgi:hypothetical protein